MKSIAGPGRMPWAGGIDYCERSESADSVLHLSLSGDRRASCLVSAGGLRFCGLPPFIFRISPGFFNPADAPSFAERVSAQVLL